VSTTSGLILRGLGSTAVCRQEVGGSSPGIKDVSPRLMQVAVREGNQPGHSLPGAEIGTDPGCPECL
jgi:hypothetical protein